MKTSLLLSIILFASAATTFGQQVENDDMYFNGTDRAALKKQTQPQVYADAKKLKTKVSAPQEIRAEGNINPTDSYSARNINPEFSARSQAQVAQEENEDYFVNNYRSQTAQNLNQWNNNFNNWYGNPSYSNNYYSPNIYGWNSPYYGSYYNYGNPWSNPYYQSMLSSSFSYYWGNTWNYGWGMGFNNYWYNPYNSFWGSPSMAFNMGWGNGFYNSWYPYYGYGYGGGWGYPYQQQVVVVEKNRFNTYDMRNSRSSNLSNGQATGRPSRSAYNNATLADQSRNTTGSRSTSRPEYYDRNWRYNSGNYNNSTTTSQGFTRPSLDRSSNTNNSGNTGGRSSSYTPSYTPSSSGNSGFGGGSRSSGGSSSGGSHSSGGGSRSRGR